METTGMWHMKKYICRKQANITEYIENCPIYELCTGEEQIPGSSIFVWWWDQNLNPE